MKSILFIAILVALAFVATAANDDQLSMLIGKIAELDARNTELEAHILKLDDHVAGLSEELVNVSSRNLRKKGKNRPSNKPKNPPPTPPEPCCPSASQQIHRANETRHQYVGDYLVCQTTNVFSDGTASDPNFGVFFVGGADITTSLNPKGAKIKAILGPPNVAAFEYEIPAFGGGGLPSIF